MNRLGINFIRAQRQIDEIPRDDVEIPACPHEPQEPEKLNLLLAGGPMIGMMGMGAVMMLIARNMLIAMMPVMMGVIYSGLYVLRHREKKKRYQAEIGRLRCAYGNHLSRLAVRLQALKTRQLQVLNQRHPSLPEILEIVQKRSVRLWDRRAHNPDFLEIRLGVGEVAASFSITAPKVTIPELTAELTIKAVELGRSYQRIQAAPVTLDLKLNSCVGIVGPRKLREAALKAMLAHLFSFHAPDEVLLYAIFPSNSAVNWNCLKWLPHSGVLQEERGRLSCDPVGNQKVLADLMDALQERKLRLNERDHCPDQAPHIVLLLPDMTGFQDEVAVRMILEKGKILQASILALFPDMRSVPPVCSTRLQLLSQDKAILYDGFSDNGAELKPDLIAVQMMDEIAHLLCPIRLADKYSGGDLPDSIRLLELAGVSLADLSMENRWRAAHASAPSLQVHLGMRAGQRPLIVDLKQSGAGPHGLLAGTTGSGKSELLLTLLMGLALNHHPHQVNFILIDYKGGTAMSVLEDLPHTVGVVTDLDGKQTRRALVALRSEMARREEMLTAHQVADIDMYHQSGYAEPFPYLFIVIDEFAELKDRFREEFNDVLNEFISVAQKGRALGVHLILAMQKPEGVVNERIRSNMKFRICLRVEQVQDSRNVIGSADAYFLPNHPPGRAYLQVGNNEQYELFQVARIAGPYQPDKSEPTREKILAITEIGRAGRRIPLLNLQSMQESVEKEQKSYRTEAQILVEKAHQAALQMNLKCLPCPWPDPLPEHLTLRELLHSAGNESWDGSWLQEQNGKRKVLLALVDNPVEQCQYAFKYEVQDEHLLIIGSPGSGRTTTLLTLFTSLASVYSPDCFHFYIMDLGGHQLRTALKGFPHTAGVYQSNDTEQIQKLFDLLTAELEQRKELFAETGAADLHGYNRVMKPAESLPILLVAIHNFFRFQDLFQTDVDNWLHLIREGGPYGIRFVVSAERLPASRLTDLFTRRLALRMNDKTWYTSIIGGRPDLNSFQDCPGRGFINTTPPLTLQIAQPTAGSADAQIDVLRKMGQKMDSAWLGQRPARIKVLSSKVALSTVLRHPLAVVGGGDRQWQGWIGLHGQTLEPISMPLWRYGSAALVSGPPESGKTTFMCALAASLASQPTAEELELVLVHTGKFSADLQQALDMSDPGRLQCMQTVNALQDYLADLQARVEPVSSSASRKRVILIDDYHILMNQLLEHEIEMLEQLRKGTSSTQTFLVVSVAATSLRSPDMLMRDLRKGKTGLWLVSTDRYDMQLIGLQLPASLQKKTLPPGRGFLYSPAGQTLVQVAFPDVDGFRSESV